MTPALLIFSDLDGTLLEHNSYRHDAARPALELCKKKSIPIILATSKTAAEVQTILDVLDLCEPAIVENGGGIWLPEDHFLEPGEDEVTAGLAHNVILDRLNSVSLDLRQLFLGFSSMTLADVMERTGLDEDGAKQAKDRQWSEPGVWIGDQSDFDQFSQEIKTAGLKFIRGGRFLHILGNTNKLMQMERLTRAYQSHYDNRRILTAALGDAPNDRAMIEAADYGFVIPNPSGTPLPELKGELSGRIKRAGHSGPTGWNEAVVGLLEQLGI